MKALLVFPALVISVVVHAQLPNSTENRLHKIYESSYSQEVSDDMWRDSVSSLESPTYTIAAGDTLWDLSALFFGDGFFWSKIWAYNAGLTNPHLLSIGRQIQFFTGSIEQPPGLQLSGVSQQSSNNSSLGAGNNIARGENAGTLYPGAPSLPSPRYGLKPVMQNLPDSFDDSQSRSNNLYSEEGISLDLRPPDPIVPSFLVSEFLYESKPEDYPRVAEFIESEQDKSLNGLHDKIYVNSEEELRPGDVLTIMASDYRFERNGVSANVLKYLGRARVDEMVSKNKFRCTVILSLAGVRRGAWLVREPLQSFANNLEGRFVAKKLRVIGGGQDNSSRIYGRGDTIYLQGGKDQGVVPGDVIPIYKLRSSRYREASLKLSSEVIGYAKIFNVDEHVSSAFVVSSTEPIMPGDRTVYEMEDGD